MGMRPDDELVDLFPGTGAVTRAWEEYRNAFGSILTDIEEQEETNAR